MAIRAWLVRKNGGSVAGVLEFATDQDRHWLVDNVRKKPEGRKFRAEIVQERRTNDQNRLYWKIIEQLMRGLEDLGTELFEIKVGDKLYPAPMSRNNVHLWVKLQYARMREHKIADQDTVFSSAELSIDEMTAYIEWIKAFAFTNGIIIRTEG